MVIEVEEKIEKNRNVETEKYISPGKESAGY